MNKLTPYKALQHAIFGFIFCVIPQATLYADANPSSLPIFSRIYDPQRDPISDGHKALQIALKNNRKVLIEVGGNWCAWCHKLDKFIHSHPQLKKDFFNTFVLLKVNVSEENDNKAFLKVFPPVYGYPHMFVTDHNGKILESKDTADFLENKQYSVVRFYEFINKWKANKLVDNAQTIN